MRSLKLFCSVCLQFIQGFACHKQSARWILTILHFCPNVFKFWEALCNFCYLGITGNVSNNLSLLLSLRIAYQQIEISRASIRTNNSSKNLTSSFEFMSEIGKNVHLRNMTFYTTNDAFPFSNNWAMTHQIHSLCNIDMILQLFLLLGVDQIQIVNCPSSNWQPLTFFEWSETLSWNLQKKSWKGSNKATSDRIPLVLSNTMSEYLVPFDYYFSRFSHT